jgi:hypothetical protein
MLDTYLNILVSSLSDCCSFALLSAVPVCNIFNIHNLLGFFECYICIISILFNQHSLTRHSCHLILMNCRLWGFCFLFLQVGWLMWFLKIQYRGKQYSLPIVQRYIRCFFYLTQTIIQMFGFLHTSKGFNFQFNFFPFNLRYLQLSMLIIFWLLRSSRSSILFFILFVLIGVYFVTNLILAVVYDSFKSEVIFSVPLLFIILTWWYSGNFDCVSIWWITKQILTVLKYSFVVACKTSFGDGSYEKSYVGESF